MSAEIATAESVISTYSESHRKSYLKRRDSEIARMKAYYENNKETIRARRKARYQRQKLAAAAIISAEPAAPNIQPEIV
jgi:hypothetical protein